MVRGRVVNCSIFAGNLNANWRPTYHENGFSTITRGQITGDLSSGKTKNGMMWERLAGKSTTVG